MSEKLVLTNSEKLQDQRLIAQEQQRILHNNLMQRILKLRDKLSSTISLTKITEKLNDLEIEIRGGCDLEEIDIEIIAIEKIVTSHLQSFLQFFIYSEKEYIQTKTLDATADVREIDKIEKL